VVIVGVLLIFAFTQWFSQWTRSTLIGFCVAPAVAAMTIGYQSFVIVFLQAPWWILLPTFGVAMLATRVMLCPWMDGRFDWRYWTSHGALLLVALGIPLIPFLYTWATHPDMPSAMKRELAAEAEGYQRSSRPAMVDLVTNTAGFATNDATAESGDVANSVSEMLDSMERELSATHGPIAIPWNNMRTVVAEADLMSLHVDVMTDADKPGDREQADRLRYQRIMVLLDNVVRRTRLAERMWEQDYADGIERWLVGELSRPGRQQILTSQQYARIVAGLADQDARHQARRRAVVMAWSTTQGRHQFENVVATTDQRALIAPRWLVAQRDTAMAAAGLLKHLESSVPTPIAYPGELSSMGLGSVPAPGKLWHRPWETKAKQLAESLKSTPATKVNDDE
jgi:hypothetical protein